MDAHTCTQALIECLKSYLDAMNDEWSRFNVKWCMTYQNSKQKYPKHKIYHDRIQESGKRMQELL